MRYSTSDRPVKALLVMAALVGLAGCSDGGGDLPTESSRISQSHQPAATPANERLAQLVALALREPSVRELLNQDFRGSPVDEGKVFLNTYLQGAGSLLLQAMSSATGAPEADILDLLTQTGPMEMYLPVDAHRAHWNGGDDLIVATLMLDHTVPTGFDLNGNFVQLSAETAPSVPTISIVPTESFDEMGNPVRRNVQRSGSAYPQPGGINFDHSTTGTMYYGLWVNEVHTSSDYEGWAKGNAEFEMHLENGSASPRSTVVCAENQKSIEPYRWDLNGVDYYSPFLLGLQEEIPGGASLVISLWEDDDTTCSNRPNKDYVKLAADAFANAAGAYKAVKNKQFENGEWIMQLGNAFISARSIIQSSDDFVGVSAGTEDLNSIAKEIFLHDEYMNRTARITLQWKSDTAH